jgi:gamma-glutamyl:cysteine ligase YbdK (ATP-grasp superfamily)
MIIGTEHEYSINDLDFNPLPISDKIIKSISGAVEHEVNFCGIKISKELQKHVLELIPSQPGSLTFLEDQLYQGLQCFYNALKNKYKFLGLGMHPLLTLDKTACWDHDEQEYYHAYDRLFNIRQHGWLNIQALQINIPYEDQSGLVRTFNKIRSLLPYLVAVSASSPFVEGRPTGHMDSRLVYYRENQRKIPEICNEILPERLEDVSDYIEINRQIFSRLKECGTSVLCKEWVNSRGVIVRFTRRCLEIKAIDEQECLHSDMAIAAFLLALLRFDFALEEDEGALRSLLDDAISYGTDRMRPELEKLYRIAYDNSTDEERRYLPIVADRIDQGSLAEVMVRQLKETGEIKPLLAKMENALRSNRSYVIG